MAKQKISEIIGTQGFGVLPEIFECVISALLLREQMHDEVNGIENEPTAGLEAIFGQNLNLVFLEDLFEVVAEGL